MEKQNAYLELKEQIRLQETQSDLHYSRLRDQFAETLETLKPANLIKDVLFSPDSKNTLTDTAIGMVSGFVVKKAIVRSSGNGLLNILGTMTGMGIANAVANHTEGIKSVIGKILSTVFKKENGKE